MRHPCTTLELHPNAAVSHPTASTVSHPTPQSLKFTDLFSIPSGGLDPALRSISISQLVERDTPGYAIGGLAGGESKDDFWRMVAISAAGGEPIKGLLLGGFVGQGG